MFHEPTPYSLAVLKRIEDSKEKQRIRDAVLAEEARKLWFKEFASNTFMVLIALGLFALMVINATM